MQYSTGHSSKTAVKEENGYLILAENHQGIGIGKENLNMPPVNTDHNEKNELFRMLPPNKKYQLLLQISLLS